MFVDLYVCSSIRISPIGVAYNKEVIPVLGNRLSYDPLAAGITAASSSLLGGAERAENDC